MDNVTLIVIIGAIVAGFVQGLSGFAFGMVAMSFWAWVLEPRLAATMAVFGALTGQILAAVTVRRGFNLKLLLPFILEGFAGIPIGIALLPFLDMLLFKTFLGGLLILWCPTMLIAHQLPRITLGRRVADAVVGTLGGIMSGIGGFAGVIPTLWCTLRGFDKDAQRAVIQNFNFAALLVTMVIYISKGFITKTMLPMFAIVALAMLVPTLMGSRLYIGMSAATFRKMVLSLLTVSGAALLASSLPKLIHF
ncbi:MAG: sulfite exporter TauE/SafE family protein [Pseudomonadota bacterium]